MLPSVTATRYVTPLREGGSLPGLMEADDLGTYVVKWRAAGQGVKVLVAEVVCGELARALGLPVPALVTVDVAPELAVGEPDVEVQELLQRSAGRNLGLDYLPGALDFDAGADGVDAALAGRVLWFDALVGNVDRSWRNPNMLFWHGRLQLIDHGAALTFHHHWPGAAAAVAAALRRERARADRVRARRAPPPTPRWAAGDPGTARRRAGPGARRVAGRRRATPPAAVRAPVRRPAAGPAGARDAWLPGLIAAARPAERAAAGRPRGREPAGLAGTAAAGGSHASDERGRHFEYAVLRVVPRVERGEALNAGVLVYCRQRDYLGSRVHLDVDRLRALDPTADADGDRPGAAGGGRRLRRRARRRGGRPGGAGLAVPLAHRAAQHRDPAGAGAHRADRGPRRRGRPPAPPARPPRRTLTAPPTAPAPGLRAGRRGSAVLRRRKSRGQAGRAGRRSGGRARGRARSRRRRSG